MRLDRRAAWTTPGLANRPSYLRPVGQCSNPGGPVPDPLERDWRAPVEESGASVSDGIYLKVDLSGPRFCDVNGAACRS